MVSGVVDVIIPCYNMRRYIPYSVGSALARSFTPVNVLVIDDGSEDNVREAVESFGDRCGYFRQENQGLPFARNRGLSMTSGEYVCFLDADDILLPGMIDTLVGFLEANPHVDACHCKTLIFNNFSADLPFAEEWRPHVEWRDYLIPLSAICAVHLGSMVFRRRVFDRIGNFPTDMEHPGCEDWAFLIRCALKGIAIRYVPMVGSLYRQHPSSMSTDESSIALRESSLMKYAYRLLTDHGIRDSRCKRLFALGMKSVAARCLPVGLTDRYTELLNLSESMFPTRKDTLLPRLFVRDDPPPACVLYLALSAEYGALGLPFLAAVMFVKCGDVSEVERLATDYDLKDVFRRVIEDMTSLVKNEERQPNTNGRRYEGLLVQDASPGEEAPPPDETTTTPPELFHRLAESVPGHASFLSHVKRQLGRLHIARGRPGLAVRDLTESVYMNPYFAPGKKEASTLFHQLGRDGYLAPAGLQSAAPAD